MQSNYITTVRLKVKVWKKIHHVNTNHKKVLMAILISDKAVLEQRILAVIEKFSS